MDKERQKFAKDLTMKIKMIRGWFNLSERDLRKTLKVPVNDTGPITLTEFANIGCHGYCRLCDCLDINYDFFINSPLEELKEELKLKDMYIVKKNIQKVVEAYRDNNDAIKRILIVDNELPFLFILRMMLTKNNFFVIEAENGKEACEILFTDKVDLIISDIKMPVMDGFEFLQEFQNLNIDVPFISMSASPDIDREKMISLGASDFLKKPFATETVINCVKKYIG